MKNIREYISETNKSHHYRIKTVVPLEDKEMSRIEQTLIRYEPINITNPIKTMLQSHPLDFSGVMNAEVFIVDIELAFPASSYVLQQELCGSLNIPETYVVVRGDNEPSEIETERLLANKELNSDAKEKGYRRAALLQMSNYEDVEDIHDVGIVYGNEHTGMFLSYLKKVADARKDKEKVDAPLSGFKWLEMPDMDSQEPGRPKNDFNAEYETEHEPKLPYTSVEGNFDDDGRYYRRGFLDDEGNVHIITKKPDFTRRRDL